MFPPPLNKKSKPLGSEGKYVVESCYGNELLVTVRTLASNLNRAVIINEYVTMFSPCDRMVYATLTPCILVLRWGTVHGRSAGQ